MPVDRSVRVRTSALGIAASQEPFLSEVAAHRPTTTGGPRRAAPSLMIGAFLRRRDACRGHVIAPGVFKTVRRTARLPNRAPKDETSDSRPLPRHVSPDGERRRTCQAFPDGERGAGGVTFAARRWYQPPGT